MRCVTCDEENPAGSKFCGGCGHTLDSTPEAITTGPNDVAHPHHSDQGPRVAPRSIPLTPRTLSIAVATILGLVIAVAMVAAGNGSPEQATPPTPKQQTNESLSTASASTAASANADTAPLVSLSLDELLDQASLDWMSASESFTGRAAFTEIVLVNKIPTVAAVPDPGEPIMVFSYFPTSSWELSATIDVDWGATDLLPDSFRFIDMTGDDSPELFVAFVPYNDYLGLVFQTSEGGVWKKVVEEAALEVSSNGSLTGTENTCVPSCADGVIVDYGLSWTGSSFSKQYFDDFGNPIVLTVTKNCIGDYLPTAGAPMRRCDKGVAVEQLQRALEWAGYLISVDGTAPVADGFFGPGTETSVRFYQLRVDVPVDGVAQGSWYYELIEAYNAAMGFG